MKIWLELIIEAVCSHSGDRSRVRQLRQGRVASWLFSLCADGRLVLDAALGLKLATRRVDRGLLYPLWFTLEDQSVCLHCSNFHSDQGNCYGRLIAGW